jgi:uncharacterized protein (TIGR03083 family)
MFLEGGLPVNDNELWAAIDLQRHRTADLLEQLTDAEWQHASLCEGWTVRDVAAHLTLQQIGLLDALRMLPRYRGSLNRLIQDAAVAKAALPVDQLIAEIRAMVGSRRHNLGVTSRDTLIDTLVHGQDIARPLGRELPMPTDAAATAATQVWATLGTAKAKVFHRIPWQGTRFTATDTDWSVGAGREVRGPIAAILLVLTGRHTALDDLSGDGARAIRASLPGT